MVRDNHDAGEAAALRTTSRVLADISPIPAPARSFLDDDTPPPWDPTGDEAAELAAQHTSNGHDGHNAIDLELANHLTTDQLRQIPPPEWLVDGYLVRSTLAVLYGPSTAGKTFAAIDLALHVATGSWWHGHEVKAGPVVYLIAEGAAGMANRLEAWEQHHRIYDLGRHQPIRWRPGAVNLTDRPEVEAFAQAAATLAPALVVIDTLARCIVGVEENSARDMGIVVASLDRIRHVTGACVLAVHHTGKDQSGGARGSSALRGAVDTELELTSSDGRRTLKVAKQKDAPEAGPLRLALVPVGSSCVLVPAGQITASDEVSAGAVETLEALERVRMPGGVPSSTWMEATTCARRTFFEHRALLVSRGLVANVGTEKQPRYTPADLDEGDE